MLSHRLILKACPPACAGGGGVGAFAGRGGGVACLFTVVGAPPPLHAARVRTSSAAPGLRVRVRNPELRGRLAMGVRFMASAPSLAWTGGSGQLEHLLELVATGLEARLDGDRKSTRL